MATLRDSGLVPVPAGASPTLRSAGLVPAPAFDAGQIDDQAVAGGMGQLRRGFNSGLLSGDANALAADESVARAAGRTADADALRQRIAAIQGRAATFAPTEQDVTKLGWEPGRIADWALGAAGQGAASMLEPAGAAAGLGVASRVLGAVPTAPTRLLGGALRLAAPAAAGYLGYRQNKGEFYNDAVDDPALMAGRTPQEIDNAGTFHGAVAGALDTMLPALAGERIAGRASMRALAKAGMPAKIGLDLAGEGVTETLQGEVKRGTLGHLNPLRDTGGDTADRWNDFAGGIVGAGPLSAASHLAGKGHARLDVVDDPSNDVSGKKGAAPAAPPARENLAGSLKRRAKEIDQYDAAEAWNEVLKGVGTDDPETAYPQRHAALLKELGGRAEKGDTVAKQHLDTLSAMDPADPVSWYDDSPRDAAYQHLMGDGMDHAKVLGAYKSRKLNAQGSGEPTATAKLAASIMQDAAPEKAPGTAEDLADPKDVAEHLAHQIADFASRPKAKFGDNVALFTLADDLVHLYTFEGAKAVLAKVATAVGVEKTPMFKQLQGNLVRSDYVAFKQGQRKQRGLAAGELAAALPPEAHLALRDKGLDLTTDGGRMALLEVMQSYANGKLDRKRVEMNALLGGKEVVDKLLDMVAPGKVEEKTEVDTPKKSGGEKTAPPKPSDELSEPDDWEVDGALKNIEKAPGTKLYLFKGKQAVGSTETDHPFVPDKKTKNLPTLSSLDDRNKDGNNTLEMMQANAYTGLGGGEFGNERTRVVETIAGPMRPGEARKTRATTTESAPMQDIESAVPGTQGVGSHRIRTVSAREVMDHHGVKGGERIKVMRAYLARGDKPVMSEDDPTIQQISTLDRRINARIGETPKVLTTGVAKGGAPMPTVDNPRYLELKDLQGQRREAMTKLAAKIGVEVSEDATVEDLANAYFAGRFLVVAEQMAEKDGLRLSVAEVRKMMRRGNDDLDYSDKHKADGTQAEVQADMNLIRFPSKSAVSKDGIGVIRAGDLVEWVFENRTTFNKKDYSSDVTHAHDFRDALVEGIGALAADGFMTSLPFMINAKGQVESFADGFPPSLRLSGVTQAELDKRKAKRVAEVTEMVGPPDLEATAREQNEEPKSDNDKGVPEEFRHPGAERGAADKRATDEPNGLKERFWDAPEMEDTRSDESLVPSQTEPRKQAKGVPTERTDIAQRTEVLGSAAAGIETLTMANAVRKAEAIAASMWEALGFQMKTQVVNGVLVEADPKRDVKADPRTGRDRLERMVAALRPGSAPVAPLLSRAEAEKLAAGAKDPSASLAKLTALRQPGQGAVVAGGKQYAAPLAHLLTPAHVARLVATAKNGAKAKADLELMRSKVADALTDMKDEGFSRADITALARLLTGNEKLTPSLATAALEKMAWPARMARKAEREAATKKAAPMKATPEVAAEKVEPGIHVVEHHSSGYAPRTKHNADSAGLTVAIASDFGTAGEKLTARVSEGKYLGIPIDVAPDVAGTRLAKAMRAAGTTTLNVAGNGIYTLSKKGMTQAQVNQHIYEVIAAAHALLPITKIVTGGQTGVDIAGAIAAHKLDINVIVTMPQGFRQRGVDEKDYNGTAQSVAAQIIDGAAALKTADGPTAAPAPAPDKQVADVSAQANALMSEKERLLSRDAFDDQDHDSYHTGIDAWLQDAEEHAFAFDRKTGAPNMKVYKDFMATVEKRRPDLKAFAQAHWDRMVAQNAHWPKMDKFFADKRGALAQHPDAMKNFVASVKHLAKMRKATTVWGIHADLMQQMFDRQGDGAWREAQIADKTKRLARYEKDNANVFPRPPFLDVIKKEIALLKANDLQGMVDSAEAWMEKEHAGTRFPPPTNLKAAAPAAPDHTKVLAYLAGKLKTGGRDSLKDFLAKATVPQLLAARDAIQSFEDRSEDQLGVGAPKVAADIAEQMGEKPGAAKQVAWVAKQLAQSVSVFRKAIKDFTFAQLNAVRNAIIDLDDSEDHHGVDASRWSWALGHVESQMNLKEVEGRKLNARPAVKTFGESMRELNIADLGLTPDQMADPMLLRAIKSTVQAMRNEKDRHFSEFTPEQFAALKAGRLKEFSRLSGYTPAEIEQWQQSGADLNAVIAKYGDEFAQGLSFGIQRATGYASFGEPVDISTRKLNSMTGGAGRSVRALLGDAMNGAAMNKRALKVMNSLSAADLKTLQNDLMSMPERRSILPARLQEQFRDWLSDYRSESEEMMAPERQVETETKFLEELLDRADENDALDVTLAAAILGRKFNAQSTAQAAPTDTQIAEAKAYLTKVLGPKVIVEFSKYFTNAGEWVEAENLIRLSTAIGPGVLSVAHHEALHAFWSRAIKSHPGAVEALKRVLADGDIYERMKAMLANEPAALASMAADPEERVAYAFQFWAAGQLDVDKPATTLFAKFRKALRKVLGMVRDSEVALDLMTALHDGKLAEPSAAGRVIDSILKAQTWNEDFKRKFDRQVQGIHAAVSTSNDVLRKEVLSPTAQRLGRVLFTNPGDEADGKEPPGYINDRAITIRQYTNFLYAALKGLSERDMVAAINELQLEREPIAGNLPYAPVRRAVERVQALTARYYDYAVNDAGMTLEFRGKYHFPRVWDLSKLIEEGGKDKFIAMLMQPKYAKTMASALDLANANVSSAAPKATLTDVAEGMYRHLVDKNGVDEKGLDGEREANALLSPFFASQKERSFKWLDAEDVKPFLEKDLVGAMSRYLHQGIRAAEYARRFGEGGKDLRELLAMKGDDWINPDTDRKEQRPAHGKIAAEMEDAIKAKGIKGKEAEQMLARHMEDIKNSVAAHEGSLGNDITPTFRKWSSAAMAYQNLRLLPMSLFAAFGDVMGIAAHGAGAKATFEAFAQGLKDVYLRWKDAASDVPKARAKSVWEGIAEMIGAVDSHMFLEQMGKAHTSEFMTDFARKANRALFMANGLTAWDRSMRVSATKAAVLFLQDHASLPDKQHSKRWLAELGLAASDIPLDADGKLITDRHVLAATKGIPIEQATAEMKRLHRGIVRWVEGAVLTPNAGQRPTWASDPHYAVLFHLKQFTYSFHHTILKRAFNEANHGNMNPIGALAAAVPTMIAADMVKGIVVGGGELPAYMKAWDAGDWILHGASRAGLGGVGQFGIDAMRDPLSVMGPTVDQVANFVFNPTDILHNIHDAIPGARMIKGVPDLARVAE